LKVIKAIIIITIGNQYCPDLLFERKMFIKN